MPSSGTTKARRPHVVGQRTTTRSHSQLAQEALADLWADAPAPGEPRLRGPLGEHLTDAETEPLRVHQQADQWCIDYGSYAQGYYNTRAEALAAAVAAATLENRHLTIEEPRRIA